MEPGSTDYITSLELTEDTVIYANYREKSLMLTATDVQISNCNSGILIIASYKESVLVNIKIIDISEKTSSTFEEAGLDISGCDEVRAFAFESFSSMIPICDKKSIDL